MLEWKDEYRLGIQKIDKQHMELFTLLNKLEEADGEDVMEILKAIKGYACMHFDMEEELMKEANYPEYKIHKNAHELFFHELDHYQGLTICNQEELKSRFYEFMKNWILKHILIVDRKYCSHLYMRGYQN